MMAQSVWIDAQIVRSIDHGMVENEPLLALS
jgi:hypothetical protein